MPALHFYFQSFEISILTQVDLRRTFKFHNSKGTHQGVPIIASNMDTVGTFEMAAALAKVKDVNVSLILFPSTFVFSPPSKKSLIFYPPAWLLYLSSQVPFVRGLEKICCRAS